MNEKLSPKLLLAILVIGIQGFVDIFLGTSLNVAFPQIVKAFNISLSDVQWLSSGVMIVATISTLIAPWLTQCITVKTQFLIISLVSILGILLDALATEFSLVLIGRLFQGLGGGLGITLMFTVILQQVPLAKRGRIMGLGGLVLSFAPALGPSISGWVNDQWSWQGIFWFVLPLQVLAFLVGILTIQQASELSRPTLDLIGWGTLTLFFLSGLFGIQSLILYGLNLETLIFLGLFVLLGFFYFRHYRQTDQPIVSLAVFRQKLFSLGFASAFIAQLVLLSFLSTTPFLIQANAGQTATFAGLALLPGAIANALLSYVGGILYDRLDRRLPIIIGTVLFLLATTANLLFPSSLWATISSITLFQIGAGFWFSANMTRSISQLDDSLHSTGSALFNIANNYAAAIGTAFATGLLNSLNPASLDLLYLIRFLLIATVIALVVASMKKQAIKR
ncbi:MFS transporter [Lactococcus termiticola]|uniref:Major facilitator superfamily transporter n=1 Tax=Lactococcus termiticola TaxID=2169526 RepID=A0A2R5HFN6_9LACT|nr:MFS transporter [Lactococcus termiticola]GBG96135.1 major facilitator superfamily transporter [Lactococcus termiticola]